MDSHGQLIVLQFGTVSNWTGAHFWNLQDELHGLADQGDAACSSFDGRVLYDESTTPTSTTSAGVASSSSSFFAPRLLSFDEPDALGPTLFSNSNSSLDDDVALSASAATWGGRAVAASGGSSSSSKFASALAEREERLRRRRRRNDDDRDPDDDQELAAAASALSLSGGVSSWSDFLKAPLSASGRATTTVFAERALGWLPPQPQFNATKSNDPLPFVPGARRPGWGPALDRETLLESFEEGVRKHAERCDAFSGFFSLADDTRGWGAAAAEAQALLRDEYPRSPRVLFAMRPPDSLFFGSSREERSESATASPTEVAAALSLGTLGYLVDVFVPLASPPASLWSSGSPSHARSPCDALFRWSAAAAAAVDAATTPLRLLRQRGPSASSSPSLGGSNISSLASLLAGPRGGPLAALSAAFPLLPVGARQEDETKKKNWLSSSDVSCWSSPPSSPTSSSRPLSSGPLLFADGDLLSESVTVRGMRSSSPGDRLLSAPEALAQVKAALAAEGARAPRHLCSSRAPLHLPLPFPVGMLPSWCYERSTLGGGAGSVFGGGAPSLVRLSSSRSLSSSAAGDAAELLATGKAAAVSPAPSRHSSGLRLSRAIGGGGGAASSVAPSLAPLLSSWNVDADDAAASAEVARAWRDEYRGSGSDGVLSSGNDSEDDD